MTNLTKKQAAARAALPYIKEGMILGVGTGSTVNCLIELLGNIRLKGAVASSNASAELLTKMGIELMDLNQVGSLDLYIDGADEINRVGEMIKGGGGALTREKIVAAASDAFICLADDSKVVDELGKFPVAIEVLPQARSYVARQLVQMGGQPVYREGFVSDYGNVILDTYGLMIADAKATEEQINNIVGVVCNGIFAKQKAATLLLGCDEGVKTVHYPTKTTQ